MTHTPASGMPRFELVMLGADIGVYALARAFHERYGIRSTVISRLATGPIMNSRVIDNVTLGEESTLEDMRAELVRRGRERAAGGADTPVLLMANADGFIRFLSDHRAELEQYYLLSLVSEKLLDQISDKGHFAELCTEVGISAPATVIQDFSGASGHDWAPRSVDLPFPVVAKAAATSGYEGMKFEGKKKVYLIRDQIELDALYSRLVEAGFRDRFVIQELIPGDDTWMRSITAYCDTGGEVTLLCSAQVLLEEHTPLALGNPAAMITTALPEAMAQATRLLQHTAYEGYANFDLKVDPRDGSIKFLEVNPRIGRNNYYVTAAGANVAQFVVADVVEGRRLEPVVVDTEIVYSILPQLLVLRYITDPELKARVKRLAKKGIHHPLAYRIEGLKRRGYVALAKINQVKKFATYYPRPTDTGF